MKSARTVAHMRAPSAFLFVVGCSLIPQLFGICCWMTFGFFPSTEPWTSLCGIFTEASAASQVAALFVWMLAARRYGVLRMRVAYIITTALLLGGLFLLLITVRSGASLSVLYIAIGIAVGGGVSSLIVCWEYVAETELCGPIRRTIPISMMVSPIFFLILYLVPQDMVATLVACVLAPLSVVSLGILLGKCGKSDCDDLECPDFTATGDAVNIRGVARDIGLIPMRFKAGIACGMVLIAITTVASTVFLRQSATPLESITLANCALFLSSVTIYVVLNVFRRTFDLIPVYLAVVPFLVIALFITSFLSRWYGYLLMFIGLFAFHSVQTGFMVTSKEVSHAICLKTVEVYALASGCLYLSRYVSEKVLGTVLGSAISWEMQAFSAVTFCIYLLSVVAFLAYRTKKASTVPLIEVDGAALTDDGIRASERFAYFALKRDLSRRETEIAILLASGSTVPDIAEELCLSKNTVRTHVKSIFRKCDVHSIDDFRALVSRNI